ncbi:MAG: hypothetical protein PUA82_00915 [Eubacteriales bacterium]|nr:hypothetical protein [Eubacteriales bacterium]
MDTPITIKEGLLLIIGICVILLLIYLIRVVRALLPTLKNVEKITDDAGRLTGMASDAAAGAEDAVNSLMESTDDMADFIANNKSTVKALVSFINAVVAIKQLFNSK